MPRLTTEWVAGRLAKLEDVQSCAVVDEDLLDIARNGTPSVQFACISVPLLDVAVLHSVKSAHPRVQFVLNVPRDARITGEALETAKKLGIALGGLGDAMRALREIDPGTYVHPNVKYIERILEQHSRITEHKRLDDSRYRLERSGLPPVTIFVSNDYEVTADRIREAIERYGEFDAFVTSNPNALKISPQAVLAATTAGRRVFRWREFMSEVNRSWA